MFFSLHIAGCKGLHAIGFELVVTVKSGIKAYKLHANSYLVKPVDFTQFVKLMETLDYYWVAWNQYPNDS